MLITCRQIVGTRSVCLLVVCLMLVVPSAVHTQIRHATGQNVVPVFEGWERMSDGSFDMVFGYMNRNYEEEVNIPIGAGNSLEPGGDRGQPTHFYRRRQQFAFRVSVPKDWGDKELIWTLTAYGRTEKAYGTLATTYELDQELYRANRGAPTSEGTNRPPSIDVVGAVQRTARMSAPVELTVNVSDDGNPPARTRVRRGANERTADQPEPVGGRRESPIAQAVVRLDPGVRLGVTWVFYRGGPGTIGFEPMRTPVMDGKASTRVSFSSPGTYQVRAYADDGVLTTPADIIITVN
jgi:hypothetical protein